MSSPSYSASDLYALLPAFVRLRDQTQGGGALRALVGVLAGQAGVISDSLDQAYDDQFIETCAEWAVPYVGALIGYRPLRPLGPGASFRAEVANTIGYRQRKGTLVMLEQLAADVTGWPAIAVEFFSRLQTTQYVRNHVRPRNATLDVHDPMTAWDIGGAFDAVPRRLDVRRIASGRGRYSIGNIGLFVWRLQPYNSSPNPGTPDGGTPARMVGTNRYTFDPFGGDVPLVNPSIQATEAGGFTAAGRNSVPFPLLRYPLYRSGTHPAVEPYATEANQGATPVLAEATAPFGVTLAGERLAWSSIAICDLTSWTPPTASGIDVAIDPQLGRLVFATTPAASAAVNVDYTYAFSGDVGGGPYLRPLSADQATLERLLAAAHPVAPIAAGQAASLSGVAQGVAVITDSGIFDGTVALAPAAAGTLVVAAADNVRPVLTGNLAITAADGASVTLRGIGIGGSLTISGTGRFSLLLQHCTVRGGVSWPEPVTGSLTLNYTLSGPLVVDQDVALTVGDSLVDGGLPADTASAIGAPGGGQAGSVTIQASTVLGTVMALDIPLLENSIVTGTVTSAERQGGCVRYSYLPPAGSWTPRRFRCQPDLAAKATVAAALAANPGLTQAGSDAIAASVAAWLRPAFTSRTPGQPGYGQLADTAPDEIRFGADEGDEMGIFFSLHGPRRERNLTCRLSEYLRIGLEAGIIHAT